MLEGYNRLYDQFYHPPPTRPPLTFWRPALSLWLQHMAPFHTHNHRVFNSLLSRLREDSLGEFLEVKTQKLPSFYSSLRERVALREYSEGLREQLYAPYNGQCETEAFFDSAPEMYEMLVGDYMDYSVDLSLN